MSQNQEVWGAFLHFLRQQSLGVGYSFQVEGRVIFKSAISSFKSINAENKEKLVATYMLYFFPFVECADGAR